MKRPHEPTPDRSQEQDGPKDKADRRASGTFGLGGILGPRAEEIAAAACELGGINTHALGRLATHGGLLVKRPLRAPDKFGAEHDVFLSENELRVLKFARNYGFVPDVKRGMLIMRHGTPAEYLARHALSEQVFPTETTVEGLTPNGHWVVSQRAIKGGHPTEAAIRKYLRKLGFTNLPARFGQNGLAWFQRDLGILIMDTSPDNFISAKQGIVPIDLQIAELDGPLLNLADAAEAFFRQAPRPG